MEIHCNKSWNKLSWCLVLFFGLIVFFFLSGLAHGQNQKSGDSSAERALRALLDRIFSSTISFGQANREIIRIGNQLDCGSRITGDRENKVKWSHERCENIMFLTKHLQNRLANELQFSLLKTDLHAEDEYKEALLNAASVAKPLGRQLKILVNARLDSLCTHVDNEQSKSEEKLDVIRRLATGMGDLLRCFQEMPGAKLNLKAACKNYQAPGESCKQNPSDAFPNVNENISPTTQ